jgi:hypothetical protein
MVWSSREVIYMKVLPRTKQQTRAKITWKCTRNQKHIILHQIHTYLENNQIRTFFPFKMNISDGELDIIIIF